MPQKKSLKDTFLKALAVTLGIGGSGVPQAVQAAQEQKQNEAIEATTVWLDKLDKQIEENLNKEGTYVLTDEDFIVAQPQAVDEKEETEDFTRAQAYDAIKKMGNDSISAETAKFLIQSINQGSIKAEDINPAHTLEIAKALTAEDAEKLGTENIKILAEKYVERYNADQTKVEDKNLAAVLNSPMGKYVVGEKGINLHIDVAERLLDSKLVNLDNIGKDENTFRAYALDYTIPYLHKKIPENRKEQDENIGKLLSYSHKYAQNSDIMQSMKYSSMMGRYAIHAVFDDKHLDNVQNISPAEQAIIYNVLDDAVRKQPENDDVARISVGNYNFVAQKYGESRPQTRNNKYRKTEHHNEVLQLFLAQELFNANKQVKSGSLLDREGCELHQTRSFYSKAEAYQAYADFSEIHQKVTGRSTEPSRSSIMNDTWRDSKGDKKFDARQADFGMYVYYRENENKLTNKQKEDFEKIKSTYDKECLERMYDISSALYNGDYNKASKASAKILNEEGLSITVAYKNSKTTLRIGEYRGYLRNKVEESKIQRDEWECVARKPGTIYVVDENEITVQTELQKQYSGNQKGKKTAMAETQQASQGLASLNMQDMIAAARGKSVTAGRTKAAKTVDNNATLATIKNNSQHTVCS